MTSAWRVPAKCVQAILAPRDGGSNLKSVYAWTVASGCLFAAGSFLVLMPVSRILGDVQGGIAAIALAISLQLATVGTFAMRRFQVSDTFEQYGFGTYVASRFVTCALMLALGFAWMFAGRFSGEKRMAIFWLLIAKASEAFSEILYGRYQQKNRFDVACRILFLKSLFSPMAFIATLLVSRRLAPSLMAMAITHLAMTFLCDGALLPLFGGFRVEMDIRKMSRLLIGCAPLAVNSILLMYLSNGPKYMVDAKMDEPSMAAYGALSMISLVVAVFADFIINPQIASLSEKYNHGYRDEFIMALFRQIIAVTVLGAAGMACSWLVGTQLLTLVFGIRLVGYRVELCVLLLGGMFLALYQIGQLVLIVLRRQGWCLAGIAIASLFVFLSAGPLVERYGLFGAASCYLCGMAILAIVFGFLASLFLFCPACHPRRQMEVDA